MTEQLKDNVLNIEEAATYLLVSEKTIKRWLTRGLLPRYIRYGRCYQYEFTREELLSASQVQGSFKLGQLGFKRSTR